MKWNLGPLVVGLVVSLCVGTQASGESVTLRVSGLDPRAAGPGGQLATKLIRTFEETHPGVHIEAAPLPPTGQGTNWEIKHTQEFLAGVAPDVIMAYGAKLWDWAEAGFMLDIAPFIRRAGMDLSHYEQQALTQYAVDGKLFALPMSISTSVIYYNRNVLVEAGLQAPSATWTWQDMRGYARKLTQAKETAVQRYGIGFQGTLLYFNPWLRAAGGYFFKPENRNRILLDQPEAISAIEFLSGMIKEQILDVRGVWWGPFAESEYAMLYDGTWLLLHFLRLPTQFDLGVAPMPVGPTSRAAFLNSSSVVINSGTKHPEAAFEFARFMAGIDAMRTRLEASPDGIPALAPLWPKWAAEVSRQYPQAREGLNSIIDAFNNYTVTEPFFKQNDAVRGDIDAALASVWNGQKSARTAMQELVPPLNARLQQASK